MRSDSPDRATSKPRTLLVLSADLPDGDEPSHGKPRKDYTSLIEALAPVVLDRTKIGQTWWGLLIQRTIGTAVAQAVLACAEHRAYDTIITDGEHVGIPLAVLLKLSRARVKHVMIGHRLSTPKKRPFFRWIRVQTHIDRVTLHSKLQFDIARSALGIPEHRLAVIPFQADTDFWRPQPVAEERLVSSAGLEHRDYPTLFRAVEGLNVDVIVGAASHWSRQPNTALWAERPPNVTVGAFDYPALRDIFARSAVVVVPLFDVDFQAGITTILEAMAMGKAVVVTHAAGQTDVIQDRRKVPRFAPRYLPETSLLRELAEEAGAPIEPNGFYVPPNDPAALRRAILYLLDHPDERARLGAAARRTVERFMSLEHFAERIRACVEEGLPAPRHSGSRGPGTGNAWTTGIPPAVMTT